MTATTSGLVDQLVTEGLGDELYGLVARLFPICRSITGNGVRDTLRLVARHVALDIHEVPSGTPVFDWTVPREWNIRDAYVADRHGEKVVDFEESNLHVVSYSTPVRRRMPLAELRRHLHTLPAQPDLIPYRTSYYEENWGFCMAHRRLEALRDDDYDVVVDSTLEDGHLTYGEYVHRGETDDEVLLSAHVCHPSLADDNCSGIALLACLAERLARLRTRYTYRFVFAPGTIGAITWLARNKAAVGRIKHGLVVAMVGDGGGPIYKRSRRGDAAIDRVFGHVLAHAGPGAVVHDFSPYGYDERQYCSPGFDLPVGSFQRSKFGTFPQYHTSADNLDFVSPGELETSYRLIASALDVLEHDGRYRNTVSFCEPQLGKRGLYQAISGDPDAAAKNMAMLWTLNLADGSRSLLDIAERAELPFATVRSTATLLERHGLLAPSPFPVG